MAVSQTILAFAAIASIFLSVNTIECKDVRPTPTTLNLDEDINTGDGDCVINSVIVEGEIKSSRDTTSLTVIAAKVKTIDVKQAGKITIGPKVTASGGLKIVENEGDVTVCRSTFEDTVEIKDVKGVLYIGSVGANCIMNKLEKELKMENIAGLTRIQGAVDGDVSIKNVKGDLYIVDDEFDNILIENVDGYIQLAGITAKKVVVKEFTGRYPFLRHRQVCMSRMQLIRRR